MKDTSNQSDDIKPTKPAEGETKGQPGEDRRSGKDQRSGKKRRKFAYNTGQRLRKGKNRRSGLDRREGKQKSEE